MEQWNWRKRRRKEGEAEIIEMTYFREGKEEIYWREVKEEEDNNYDLKEWKKRW